MCNSKRNFWHTRWAYLAALLLGAAVVVVCAALLQNIAWLYAFYRWRW